ncbi:hypothetical protein OSB04_024081 [Centaurea solstitialis]|uniref:Integrase catalytic domain-containing protein n=1 Tax=Centaurea solstitialis TaxID=347529 RepID=A0AA38SM40_9ASTR|nr:hypothetical protein OSB04_024081 [Centaurea solstitialis]
MYGVRRELSWVTASMNEYFESVGHAPSAPLEPHLVWRDGDDAPAGYSSYDEWAFENPFEKFKEFQNEVQNQLDRKIKFLRSDRAGEYLSQEFDNPLMECGIVLHFTPPYRPLMNGVSERRNRTLLDMVRSMMCRSILQVSFWGHALETAGDILNRVPTKSVEKM